MISVLLTIFILSLVIHLVNSIGAQAITDLAWNIYNRLPTGSATEVKRQKQLRLELLELEKECRAISPQDEFARWAKAQRKINTKKEECDSMDTRIDAAKTSFSTRMNTVRWISTNGLRLALQFWFARRAMFWLPQHWIPRHIEWLLAFPKAETGSVSIQVWGFACAGVITLASDGVAYLMTCRQEAGQKTAGKSVSTKGSKSVSPDGTPRSALKQGL